MKEPVFLQFLLDRLQHPLPGDQAQKRMAPAPSAGSPAIRDKPGTDARNSSVLIPVYESVPGKPELILTLRTDTISHAGQISFPGGRRERSETPVQTALREMNEEVGIPGESVQVAGSLTPLYLERSNSLITPIVGYLPEKPSMTINPAEVKEAFSTPLDELLHQANFDMRPRILGGHTYDVPFWNIHSVPLWGATAMIISELLALYSEYLENEPLGD